MQLTESTATRDIFQYFTFGRIISVIAILVVTWLFIRYATRLLDLLSRRGPRIRFLAKAAEPILRIILWFAAMLVSFHLLAPTRQTFLAAVGAAAIAIGLGAQDLVKNLIGGLVILGDRPYQLGDLVQIGDAYGEIDHIGLRSTKLTTYGDTRVTIPNADILDKHVFDSNSGVPHCQVETFLYLPADADPDEALCIGYEAAYTCPYLYSAKPVLALIEDKFDQRPYQRLHIKSYVCDHRLLPRMQSDITARAKREFLRRGILKSWSPSA
ncbi:MAG TPA: mechanosensitive ion channel family protein [Patescibacteria group bacterium]|nr:mechanosensitive ion channel family protein [Patescibacteria group bacterium]